MSAFWRLIILAIPLLFILLTASQLSDGIIPWSNMGLFILQFAAAIILPAYIWSARFIIEIREKAIYLKYAPFGSTERKVPLKKIKNIEIRKVGYFERGSLSLFRKSVRSSYMFESNEAVEIRYNNGDKIILGSNNPQKLLEAMQHLL